MNKLKTLLTVALYIVSSNMAYSQQQTDTLNIFFAIDNSTIDHNNARLLDKFIADTSVFAISIYGYADFLGEASHNQHLSEQNFVKDNTIVLENIIFQPGKDIFLTESYPALEQLLEVMQKNPLLKIEIQGHICCRDSSYEDQSCNGKPLSLCRAKAVYDYLVDYGIDSTRLKYKGFGATRKRYPLEQTKQEQSMNRRVEVLILEK